MSELDEKGYYQLGEDETAQIQAIFSACFCSDEEGQVTIRKYYEQGYLLDPHTATCFKSCEMAKGSNAMNLVYSTAEWTKFAPTIDHAINGHLSDNDLQSLESISQAANIEIPEIVKSLFDKPVCHKSVVEKDQIEKQILDFLS
jgi:threonine synthase